MAVHHHQGMPILEILRDSRRDLPLLIEHNYVYQNKGDTILDQMRYYRLAQPYKRNMNNS